MNSLYSRRWRTLLAFLVLCFSVMPLVAVADDCTPGQACAAFTWDPDTHAPYSGDFNGDGLTDIFALARQAGTHSGIAFSYAADGDPLTPYVLDANAMGVALVEGTAAVLVHDTTGDGKADLTFLPLGDDRFHAFKSVVSGGEFSVALRGRVSLDDLGRTEDLTDYVLHSADFDGNGYPDLLFQARTDQNVAIQALSNASGVITAAGIETVNVPSSLDLSAVRVMVGDLDGDGRADAFVQRNAPGQHLIAFSNASGRFGGRTQQVGNNALGIPLDGGSSEVFFAELNDDGLKDFAIHLVNPPVDHPSEGRHYFLNRGWSSSLNRLVVEECEHPYVDYPQSTGLVSCDDQSGGQSAASVKSSGKSAGSTTKGEPTVYLFAVDPIPCALSFPNGSCSAHLDSDKSPPGFPTPCVYRYNPDNGAWAQIACGSTISQSVGGIKSTGFDYYFKQYASSSAPNLPATTNPIHAYGAMIPPSEPQNLTFDCGGTGCANPANPTDPDGNFDVLWNAPNQGSADDYDWRYRIEPAGYPGSWNTTTQTLISQSIAPSCTEQTVWYEVKGCHDTQGCGPSVERDIRVEAADVGPPTNLVMTDTEVAGNPPIDNDGVFGLDWDPPSACAAGIYKWRCVAGAGSCGGIATNWQNTSVTSVSGLTIATTSTPNTISFEVKACESAGGQCSSPITASVTIEEAPIPPPTISSFSVSSTTVHEGDEVTMSWTSSNATSCTSSHWGPVGLSGQESYTTTDVTQIENIVFSVTCFNSADPVQSDSANATVNVWPLGEPSNFKTDPPDPSSGTYNLTWDAVPGAAEYHVVEETFDPATQDWPETSSWITNSTMIDDIPLMPEGQYQYRVMPCNQGPCGIETGNLSVTVGAWNANIQFEGDYFHAGDFLLTWDEYSTSSEYEIRYRMADRYESPTNWPANFDPPISRQSALNEESEQFSGLIEGLYEFQVRPCTGSATCAWSASEIVDVSYGFGTCDQVGEIPLNPPGASAGHWFNPLRNGSGIDLYYTEHNQGDFPWETLVVWYTFDAYGAPRWYQGVDEPEFIDIPGHPGGGEWEYVLQMTEGQWDYQSGQNANNPGSAFGDPIGTMTIRYDATTSGEFDIHWTLVDGGGAVTAERDECYKRLATGDIGLPPGNFAPTGGDQSQGDGDGPAAPANYNGHWQDAVTPLREGWLYSALLRGDQEIALLSLYDSMSSSFWMIGESPADVTDPLNFQSMTMFALKGFCPTCRPFPISEAVLYDVGTFSRKFTAIDAGLVIMDLDFSTFDDPNPNDSNPGPIGGQWTLGSGTEGHPIARINGDYESWTVDLKIHDAFGNPTDLLAENESYRVSWVSTNYELGATECTLWSQSNLVNSQTMLPPNSADLSGDPWLSFSAISVIEHVDDHDLQITCVDSRGSAHDSEALFVYDPQNPVPDSPIATQTVSNHLPDLMPMAGGGGVSGGAATYSIPIAVPPGRKGMQPQLSLSYSSRSGNGIAGMGWSLSGLSSISRCPATAAQDGFTDGVDFDDNDRLCLDGQRLMLIQGQYGMPNSEYRTEIDSYQRITLLGSNYNEETPGGGGGLNGGTGEGTNGGNSSYFRVESKSGVTRYYGDYLDGDNVDPVQVVPSGGGVLAWPIVLAHDVSGNTIQYEYVGNSDGEVLIDAISYSGRWNFGSNSITEDGARAVEFVYENRPDTASSYTGGGLTRQTQRLLAVRTCIRNNTNVHCESGNPLVREYLLTYGTPSVATGRSLLESVEECAYRTGSGIQDCHATTTLTWDASQAGQFGDLGEITLNGIDLSDFFELDQDDPGIVFRPVADFDGDGSRESFISVVTEDNGVRDSEQLMMSVNGDGQLNGFTNWNPAELFHFLGGGSDPIDVDRDGRVDFTNLQLQTDGPLSAGEIVVAYWTAEFTPFVGTNPWSDASGAADFDSLYTRIGTDIIIPDNADGLALWYQPGDFDGDGIIDFLYIGPGPDGTPCDGNDPAYPDTAVFLVRGTSPIEDPSSGVWVPQYDQDLAELVHCFEYIPNSNPLISEKVMGVSDEDGDGRLDILVGRNPEPQFKDWYFVPALSHYSEARLRVIFNDLDSNNELTFAPPVERTDIGLVVLARNRFTLNPDVNGDGLKDFVFVEPPTTSGGTDSEWMVQMNLGGRTYGPPKPLGFNDGADFCDYHIESPHPDPCRQDNSEQDEWRDDWRPRYASLIRVADWDGDGRDEILYPSKTVVRTCMNLYNQPIGPPPGGIKPGQGTSDVIRFLCAPEVGAGHDGPVQMPYGDNGGQFPIEDLYYQHHGQFDSSVYRFNIIEFDDASDGTVDARVVDSSAAGMTPIYGSVGWQIDDIYGDGVVDTLMPIGCRHNPFGTAFDADNMTLQEGPNPETICFLFAHDDNGDPAPDDIVALYGELIYGFYSQRGFGSEDPSSSTNRPQPPDFLQAVDNGAGITTQWDYYPLSSSGDRTSGLPLYRIPSRDCEPTDTDCTPYVFGRQGDLQSSFYFTSSMYVVSDLFVSNGNPGEMTWSRYGYEEAIYDPTGRGFQGFRTISEVQQGSCDGSVCTEYANSDVASGALQTTSYFHQEFPLAGRLREQWVRLKGDDPAIIRDLDPSDHISVAGPLHGVETPISRTGQYWNCLPSCSSQTPANPVIYQIYQADRVEDRFDPVSREPMYRALSSVPTAADIDAYGNVLFSEQQTDWFDGDIDKSLRRVQVDTNRTVSVDLTHWWIDRLGAEQVDVVVSYPDRMLPSPLHDDQPVDLTRAQDTGYLWYDGSGGESPGDPQWRQLKQQIVTYPVDGSPASFTEFVSYDGYGNANAVKTCDGDCASATGAPPREVQSVWSDASCSSVEPGYFPIKVTNPEGHEAISCPDRATGQPLWQRTYLNSSGTYRQTNNVFDGFGMVLESQLVDAGGAPIQPTTFARVVAGGIGSQWAVESVSDGSPRTRTDYDAAGRAIRSLTQGFGNTNYNDLTTGPRVQTESTYDERGRMVTEAVPYYIGDPVYHTTYTYDGLGRTVTKNVVRDADSGDYRVHYGYDGHTTNIVAGPATKVGHDGGCGTSSDPDPCLFMSRRIIGELVLDTTDALGSWTHFWYDASDAPIVIEAPPAQAVGTGPIIQAVYNDRGQKVEVFDPNMGHWEFDYNGFDELTSQTDARGVITDFEYDKLGRIKKRYGDDPGQRVDGSTSDPLIEETWQYDCVFGLLCESIRKRDGHQVYRESITYDTLLGLPTRVWTYIAREEQNPATTVLDGHEDLNWYDAHGRLKASLSAGNAGAHYQYDPLSFESETELFQQFNDPDAYLRRVFGMTARGQLDQVVYGNGTQEDRAYHPSTGQLARQCLWPDAGGAGACTASTGGGLYEPYYEYDSFGNLIGRGDGATGRSETFEYDLLHRLTHNERDLTSGPLSVNYGYDLQGNFTYKDDFSIQDVHAYQYGDSILNGGPAGPNAVTSVDITSSQSATFAYDANGNMTQSDMPQDGDDFQAAYDRKNLPTFVRRGIMESFFHYGPNDQRYRHARMSREDSQSSGTPLGETHYIGTTELEMPTPPVDNNAVFLADNRRSRVGDYALISDRDGLSYLIRDRLGSVARILADSVDPANASESILKVTEYGPFGRPRDADWSDDDSQLGDAITRRGFTDHEHLDAQFLIHMNGRSFDYRLGRFTGVDPIVQFPMNSQSQNPYSYVLNNPMSGTDPTGYASNSDGAGEIDCERAIYCSIRFFAERKKDHRATDNGSTQSGSTDARPNENASDTNEPDGRPNETASGKEESVFSIENGAPEPEFAVRTGTVYVVDGEEYFVADTVYVVDQDGQYVSHSHPGDPNSAPPQSEALIPIPILDFLPGGVFFKAAGRAATNGTTIARQTQLEINRANGATGEAMTEATLRAQGTFAGRRVTIETSTGARSVIDFVRRESRGFGVTETKTGNARLSTGQIQLLRDIEAGIPVIPRGNNAASAGLTPGRPIVFRSFLEDRPF